ncbi:hypothetical protein [Nocardia sp. IFM 10818]
MSAPAVHAEYETFSLEKVCELTGALSPDWLYRRIVRRELTAVHNGKSWRMTRADMAAVVAYMRALAEREVAKRRPETAPAAEASSVPLPLTGLTPRGANRLRRRGGTP